MSNQIKEKTSQILDEVNEKLLSENIKKNITILNVTGSYETPITELDDYTRCLVIADEVLGISITGAKLKTPGIITNNKLQVEGVVTSTTLRI